jgi:hypothetical protein
MKKYGVFVALVIVIAGVASNAHAVTISLSPGWNLISLPVQPANTAIASVLSGIAGSYQVVWGYPNQSWDLYDPNDTGGSTLATMQAGNGYWIKMTSAKTLSVSGTTPPQSLSLLPGWNLIGYDGSGAGCVASQIAFSGLQSGNFRISWSWSYPSQGWQFYDPTNSSSTLNQLCPGVGYWINVEASDSFGIVTSLPSMKVNGTAGQSVSDGTSLYVVTIRPVAGNLQDVFLSKFNQATRKLVWEMPVLATPNFDEAAGIALMGSYVYVFCVRDDPSPYVGLGLGTAGTGTILVEKLDVVTGVVTQILNMGDGLSPLGFVADPATSTLYVSFTVVLTGIDNIYRVDASSGNVLGQTQNGPDDFSIGLMAVGPNGLYSAGTQQSPAWIKVIEYSKDLGSELWSTPYNSGDVDTGYSDAPTGIALSNSNSLFVGGCTNIGAVLFGEGSLTRNVLLNFNAASGSIASTTDLGQEGGLKEMAFDSSGRWLFGVGNSSVVKIDVTTMAITNLGIAATHLTVDTVDGRLYVSNGTNKIGIYDLNGNPE